MSSVLLLQFDNFMNITISRHVFFYYSFSSSTFVPDHIHTYYYITISQVPRMVVELPLPHISLPPLLVVFVSLPSYQNIREREGERKKERYMEGLQRSDHTFRRSGSSGLVWDDDYLSGELTRTKRDEGESKLRHSNSVGSSATGQDRRSTYRTHAVSPALDPPSPDVSGCLLCGILGKPKSSRSRPSQARRH